MARIDIDVEMLDEIIVKATRKELEEMAKGNIDNDKLLVLAMFGSCVRHNVRDEFMRIVK